MKRPTLYLHIGQTKTATTTLQAFCHRNRPWLLARGVLYPESPPAQAVRMKPHHLVESLHAPDGPDSAPWRALKHEAEGSGANAVLVSDEVFWHLHGAHPERRPGALAWLAEQVRGFDVRIVCYLRRQDRWVESWFNQQAKSGLARTARLGFDEFVAHWERSGLLDYDRVLADWAAAFGEAQLGVHAFERGQLRGGDLLDDFFGRIGLADLEGAWRPDNRQTALSRPASLLMNAFNRAGADEELRARIRRALRPQPHEGTDSRCLLAPERASALLAAAQAGNAEVARRYRHGAPLFEDQRVHDESQHYPELTAADRAELMARLPVGTGAPDWLPTTGPGDGQPAALPLRIEPLPASSAGPTAARRTRDTGQTGQTREPEGSDDGPAPATSAGCERVYIYTIPKAGTYLMSEFVARLGWASSGWHVSQNKVLHTLSLDAATNSAEPSRAMVRNPYLTSFRQLATQQHAFGHFSPMYVPASLLVEKGYRIIAVKRHPREVLVSEFIDFRHRRRDVAWISEARIPDHHEAFATYVREHGPVIRNICVNFLLTEAMAAQPDYLELLGGKPRHLFVDFRNFIARTATDDAADSRPSEAARIATFLGHPGSAQQIAGLHAQALEADNKTRADGLRLPYERASLWTAAARQAYQALGLEALAERLGCALP